jgi:hypothetical protein
LFTSSYASIVLGKIKERVLTKENLRELVRLINEEMDASAEEYRERLDTLKKSLRILNVVLTVSTMPLRRERCIPMTWPHPSTQATTESAPGCPM